MPKYYVTCMDLEPIVSADDEMHACCITCDRHGVFTVNVPWIISERGFGKHEDDVMISDHDIMREYLKRYKRKKDL